VEEEKKDKPESEDSKEKDKKEMNFHEDELGTER